MMCALAPQTPAENVAQFPLKLLSCTLVEFDQTDTIADFPPISALHLSHQRRKQASKYFNRTRSIGGRERRPRNGAATEMIKLAGMASQVRFNLAQTSRPAKLCIQHRDQMSFGFQAARIPIGTVLLHKPIEDHERNMLQNSMKDDILVLHGFDPFSRPVDSQLTGIE